MGTKYRYPIILIICLAAGLASMLAMGRAQADTWDDLTTYLIGTILPGNCYIDRYYSKLGICCPRPDQTLTFVTQDLSKLQPPVYADQIAKLWRERTPMELPPDGLCDEHQP